jgi:hypothetical protein
MNPTLPKLGAVVAIFALGFGLASCSATKQDAPEPTGDNVKPGTHTRVIQMPNGFRNIAATCEGTTGIYVTSRGIAETDPQPSSVALLANDPACGGTGK